MDPVTVSVHAHSAMLARFENCLCTDSLWVWGDQIVFLHTCNVEWAWVKRHCRCIFVPVRNMFLPTMCEVLSCWAFAPSLSWKVPLVKDFFVSFVSLWCFSCVWWCSACPYFVAAIALRAAFSCSSSDGSDDCDHWGPDARMREQPATDPVKRHHWSNGQCKTAHQTGQKPSHH